MINQLFNAKIDHEMQIRKLIGIMCFENGEKQHAKRLRDIKVFYSLTFVRILKHLINKFFFVKQPMCNFIFDELKIVAHYFPEVHMVFQLKCCVFSCE